MTGKLRFALIGAGRMGERWSSVLSASDKASLILIADTGSGKAKKLAAQIPNCRPSSDDEAAVSDKDIDAVLIATPHKDLGPLTLAALRAGKHVLCEKPGAIDPAEIKRSIDLAKKNQLVYMIGYNHRFHDGFIKARKLYEQGVIGKILFIRARYGFGGRPGYDKEWRLDKTVSGGGHLIDQGVHMIDLAKSFIGEISQSHGFTSDTFWKRGVEDNAFVMIQGKNKAIGSIHVSLTQWQRLHNFEIYGTKGYLSIEGLGQKYGPEERLVLGQRPANFTDEVKETLIKCNPKADDSLKLELAEFISAVKEGRQTTPSPQEAYETLGIVKQVYKGSKL